MKVLIISITTILLILLYIYIIYLEKIYTYKDTFKGEYIY